MAGIRVLDDYQNVALSIADWSVLNRKAAVTVFNDHMSDTDAHVAENASVRSGGWQRGVGGDLSRRTLGVPGLGNIGGAVAQIGCRKGNV